MKKNQMTQAGAVSLLTGAGLAKGASLGANLSISLGASLGAVFAVSAATPAAAQGPSSAARAAAAPAINDEIIVTAQRREETLQAVPIAVSAFSAAALADRQIEGFIDVQLNTPNFTLTRNQFTNVNIAIRGVGNSVAAASSEDAVSVHVNEVFIAQPRLFETEFFDVERVEVLRGPQGTLYGRNATGGVINIVTAKANTEQVEGYVDAEYGNFDSVRVQGALNVPVTETLAARVAGIIINRDGFTENLFDGRAIDDRNIHAVRGSMRWLPTDNTVIDITANHMREDDNRARSQKQACADGPLKPLLGCQPDAPLDFTSTIDQRAGFAGNASSEAFALITGVPASAAFGLYSVADAQEGVRQPADPRVVNQDFRPTYEVEDTVIVANAQHDFETFSVKLNGGYGDTRISTRNDFDGGVGPALTTPEALALSPGLAAIYGDGLFPISEFDTGANGGPDGLVGLIGGRTQGASDRLSAVDLSVAEFEYWTAEAIVTSDFDGPVNFLLGANRIESTGFADYGIAYNTLDYTAQAIGTLSALADAGGDPDAAAEVLTNGAALYTPYFYNDSEDNFLDSTSIFGEIYVDITDTLKFTGGVRRNWDTKGVRDRGNLFDGFLAVVNGTLPPGAAPYVLNGTTSIRPLLDPNEETQGDPGAVNDFRDVEADFNATTGRAVLQWTPNEQVQTYVSYSRGYKPGGFNPRTNIASVPLTFERESINAFELGVKSTLFDRKLSANLTGFYYDYTGLQVARVVGASTISDNIDAEIWGVEGEFVLRPDDRWTLDLNAAYLNTSAGAFSTVDVRNPTQFQADTDLFADIILGTNCIVENNGAPSLIGQQLDPTNPQSPVIQPFFACSALAAATAARNDALGTNYVLSDGIETSVQGNELPGSPSFQISGGVQYDAPIGDFILTPRVDAYYQSSFYSNIFNTIADRIDGYAYLNAQIRFAPKNAAWHARVFMQNVTDEDAVTGHFNIGQNGGNFTNVFLLEPRRWGVGVGARF